MRFDDTSWTDGRLSGLEDAAQSVGIYASGHLKQSLWLARRCHNLATDPTPIAFRVQIVADHDKMLEDETRLAVALAQRAYHLAKMARRVVV